MTKSINNHKQFEKIQIQSFYILQSNVFLLKYRLPQKIYIQIQLIQKGELKISQKQCIQQIIQLMSSIRQIYTHLNHLSGDGVEGYHVDNKYYDPAKMKEQRLLETSKDKLSKKNNPDVKKISFIDEVQKKQAKLPGPCSYDPKEIIPKSKTQTLNPPTRRQTIFDEMEHANKKYNFPGAPTYSKVEVEVDRVKLKSNISKAQNANYLDSSMRSSSEYPGVGEYNAYHGIYDKRAAKWIADNEKKKSVSTDFKLPPVGTYNPLPMAYDLFDNSLGKEKKDQKRYKSYFCKQERFKKSKEKTLPFYNVLSEWGMKDKRTKKDILARISLPNSNRSVYR